MKAINMDWKGAAILILGMVVAAVPGFMLASYCINYFDEPYQILNAYEWKSSIYSPLSAWFYHLYGDLVGWKYLYFRYFSYCIAWVSIFLMSLYASIRSSFSVNIIIAAIISTYFLFIYKTFTICFGWDSLTFLFLIVDIILFIEIIRKPNLFNILLISLISTLLIFVRIPNICVVLFNSVIFITLIFKAKERKSLFYYFLVYIAATCVLSLITVWSLYGSVRGYIDLFAIYKVGDHSANDIFRSFFRGMALTAVSGLVFYLLYVLLCKISGKVKGFVPKYLIYLLFSGLFLLLLWPLPNREYGNVTGITTALYYLALVVLFIKFYRSKDWQKCIGVFAIALISTVSAIGSNIGFVKSLMWPAVPIVAFYAGKKISKNLKTYFWLWVVSLFAYSIFALNHKSFFNQPLSQMTYEFPQDAGVMAGMKTYKEEGEKIYFIYKEMEKYRNMGYEIVPLKDGNSYIWEYLILTPNLLQRHNFGNWNAFEDKDYVNAIQSSLTNSNKPMLIVFMQDENPIDNTLMENMLKKNATRILKKTGYSFWTVRG